MTMHQFSNDPNHKLLTLQDAHIVSISLAYVPTEQFEDTYGNLYKYESEVVTEKVPGNPYSTKRWRFDTWLLDDASPGHQHVKDVRQ